MDNRTQWKTLGHRCENEPLIGCVKNLGCCAWHSPTVTTWFSFVAKTMATAVVLPVALRRLPVEDINVWQLFSVFLNLQLLLDLGFCSTFTRAVAYCMAGAPSPKSFAAGGHLPKNNGPNVELLDRVLGAMRFSYHRLGILFVVFLVLIGTPLVFGPIQKCGDHISPWLAWASIVGAAYANMRTSYLSVALQGLNAVALARRWDALTSVFWICTATIALTMGGGILAMSVLILATSIGLALRNRALCKTVLRPVLDCIPKARKDFEIMSVLWPGTWRTGVSVLMSFGVFQMASVANAQIVSSESSAGFMLCMRVMQMVNQFSMAPFYSKLGLLPALRATGQTGKLLMVATKAMRNSLWSYSICYGAVGLLAPPVLRWLRPEIIFPSSTMVVLLGATFFIERFAAMHLQLYMTGNDVISHVANGVTGTLCIITAMLLVPSFGSIGFAVGLLTGYLLFYSWYPVWHSYREFQFKFSEFETRTSLGPFLTFIAISTVILCS